MVKTEPSHTQLLQATVNTVGRNTLPLEECEYNDPIRLP